MISHLPIVIVGAGPVGLTAALLLVDSGHPVLVVEKNSGLARDMRASTFHPATLDLLEPLGLAEPLIAGGSIVQAWQFMIHGTKRHAVFDLELIGDATRHPYFLLCEQYHLTSLLLERLETSPLFEIRFNHELAALDPGEDGVSFQLNWPGGEVKWRADWMIAADGGDSAVRQCMGLPFRAGKHSKTTITLVLDHPFHHEVEGLLGDNYAWTRKGYYSLMQIRNLWRFSYGPRPGQSATEAVSAPAAQKMLQSLFPGGGPYQPLQSNHYAQQEHCMDAFRHGRVLFAGDSAHLNVPVGGMGMNSGVHDAFCLAEHLSPVLRGEDDALLDRYSRRRRTIAVEEVQRLSAQLFRWLAEPDPDRREAIWSEWTHLLESRRRTREFLLESTMIRSRQREAEID
jgi:2-polyprenyl-6-methoxyphenol hydroxylase-like FAD-dependent oxidoreductase